MLKRLAATGTLLIVLALSLVSCGEYYEEGVISVKSPDEAIVLNFELKDLYDSLAVSMKYPIGKNMYYNVSWNGKQVLTDSPLGLNFGRDGAVLGKLVITAITNSSGVDKFDTPLGKQAKVSTAYNEVTVSLREKTIPAKTFDIIFRAYNDGVAFRYSFPEQKPKIKFPSANHDGFLEDFVLVSELTGYCFGQDVDAYSMFIPALPHNYEKFYSKIKISEITRDSTAALPFVVVYEDGPAMCIAEANLTDYTASYLTQAREMDLGLTTILWPRVGEKEAKVLGTVPFHTPWRVLMIAQNAGKLIESNLILALSEPNAIGDISWIKPGKASWDWWSGQVTEKKRHRVMVGGYKTETYEHYIEFAHEAGLEYCLIDAGWYGMHRNPEADITTPVPEVDMEYLTNLADSLDVKLLLWLNWECVEKQMDQAFPLYQKWGIAGVKIDYMDRDDQEMIELYRKMLAKAAQHKLVVDYHGAYRPAGIRRTYPNLITREGVVGLEYCKWSDWAGPEHNVTIPYTRMLLGPMDYTPGAFQNAFQKDFKSRNLDPMSMGTRCHQLAMFVVYESPLQVLADSPTNYRKEKGLDFISTVPTVWDETRFIAGDVGDYIVLARKKGDKWYLGAMTDWDEREIELPLDFLENGAWKANLWADSQGRRAKAGDVDTSEIEEITSGETLTIKMSSGGGFAAVFEPAQ